MEKNRVKSILITLHINEFHQQEWRGQRFEQA